MSDDGDHADTRPQFVESMSWQIDEAEAVFVGLTLTKSPCRQLCCAAASMQLIKTIATVQSQFVPTALVVLSSEGL